MPSLPDLVSYNPSILSLTPQKPERMTVFRCWESTFTSESGTEGTTRTLELSHPLHTPGTGTTCKVSSWDTGPLRLLLPHFQLVYLPGEELLLCPQPFGGVGSRARKAPSGLGRGHFVRGGGQKREMLHWNGHWQE